LTKSSLESNIKIVCEQVRFVRENSKPLQIFMAKKTTFRDIAKQADVALSTVSQVLNNRPGVSQETRLRVLEVASELGYRQRIAIDSVISPRLNTIALLTKRHNGEPVRINPFYSYALAGAERECQRHNIGLMYANIEVDEDSRALTLPTSLLDQRVDGIIIVGTFLEETISEITRYTGHNVVLIDAYTSGKNSHDSVLIDNLNGAFNAVSYLIDNGHQHIGLIGSHARSHPSILERRDGYLKALQAHQIDHTYIEDSVLERASAYEATVRLMNRAPEITAIFACNDNVAIGVMNAVQKMGLSVPEDVSVVGFDDIDLAQEVTPPLTTVHVDKVLLGVMAVRMLKDRTESPERPALTTTLSTQLIVRDSVRKLINRSTAQ
jgi:LacI family transcriptional regulator